MALYGYARVSTFDQSLGIQRAALKAAGCDVIRAEKASGTRRDGRTELQVLLDFLRPGDALVVTRIDQLARSLRDLQNIAYGLKERRVILRATEQPIDTGTAAGKAFLDMLGVFAEFETNFRKERQAEGIAAANSDDQDGNYVIDMDAVAEAAGKDGEKPPFYYAEEQQQHKFSCAACDAINDIIGRFGFCCVCDTRNDLQELEGRVIPVLRKRVNAGAVSGSTLRELASMFDSFVSQYVKQMLDGVPMVLARKNRLPNMRFHNLKSVADELKETFGIDLFAGLKAGGSEHASLMFFRRHVYEHNGGQVDERYLQESGDTTVRLHQTLREDAGSLHRFANSVARMARSLHEGFHQIFPPEEGPIKAFQEKKAGMVAWQRQGR